MEGRIVNVRKLVSLDITLHGNRFILTEFGLGTPGIILLGLFVLATGQPILGAYLILTGINYIPLLVFAIATVRRGTAESDVQADLAANPHYVRKYSLQQFLIFFPLSMIVLALVQRSAK